MFLRMILPFFLKKSDYLKESAPNYFGFIDTIMCRQLKELWLLNELNVIGNEYIMTGFLLLSIFTMKCFIVNQI